jgi:hypothetical protein
MPGAAGWRHQSGWWRWVWPAHRIIPAELDEWEVQKKNQPDGLGLFMKVWRRRAEELKPPLPSAAILPVEVTASEPRLWERRSWRYSPCGPTRRVAEASCCHWA